MNDWAFKDAKKNTLFFDLVYFDKVQFLFLHTTGARYATFSVFFIQYFKY